MNGNIARTHYFAEERIPHLAYKEIKDISTTPDGVVLFFDGYNIRIYPEKYWTKTAFFMFPLNEDIQKLVGKKIVNIQCFPEINKKEPIESLEYEDPILYSPSKDIVDRLNYKFIGITYGEYKEKIETIPLDIFYFRLYFTGEEHKVDTELSIAPSSYY